MSKIEPGLEARYHVARLHDAEGKHDDCPFFVLDPKHDPTAIEALRTYSRKTPNPRLADDLDALVEKFAAPTAADQPTTEPSAADAVRLGTIALDARDEALSDLGETEATPEWGVLLAVQAHVGRAVLAALAPAPQPAADTETEVQWGVRGSLGDQSDEVVKGQEDSARRYVKRTGEGTVMTRIKTTTYTPWEEA